MLAWHVFLNTFNLFVSLYLKQQVFVGIIYFGLNFLFNMIGNLCLLIWLYRFIHHMITNMARFKLTSYLISLYDLCSPFPVFFWINVFMPNFFSFVSLLAVIISSAILGDALRFIQYISLTYHSLSSSDNMSFYIISYYKDFIRVYFYFYHLKLWAITVIHFTSIYKPHIDYFYLHNYF